MNAAAIRALAAPPATDALSPEARAALLRIARESLAEAVRGDPFRRDLAAWPVVLRAPGACFVTLSRDGALRGCIGSLEPHRALWADAADNAVGAGLRDPRFLPVRPEELGHLRIAMAVLGRPEPIAVADRAALLAALRPEIDGLVISDQGRRATFLPKVWEQLPEPEEFLARLMQKAGLPTAHWSPTLRVERYGAEEFDED
jgi:AmmeMemoRadiSam system protein A